MQCLAMLRCLQRTRLLRALCESHLATLSDVFACIAVSRCVVRCCVVSLPLSCHHRALAGRSIQQQQHLLPSAELVSAAASALRPLVSLTENAVQLLPLALMRRCPQGIA
jgi:hypothetical protein